jgi:ABC-type glutathione transport system ATPase component
VLRGHTVQRPVISVRNLAKRYGSTIAVADVSFEVNEGEIFGLIGPNGAGKTTTMECVEGLRRHDSGTMSVLGLDPHRDASTLRLRIGVQHQGRVLLFGPEILFRSQPHGSYKLLFNGLYLSAPKAATPARPSR